MPIDAFKALAAQLLRTHIGWTTRISKVLGISDRQVRHWVQAGQAPKWADDEITLRVNQPLMPE